MLRKILSRRQRRTANAKAISYMKKLSDSQDGYVLLSQAPQMTQSVS
jgi:hypothetical protein